MDDLEQAWDRQSELLERILDGEPIEDVLASEPDEIRTAVLTMLQHHREAEKTGFLDAPPTLVQALHNSADGPSLTGGERLSDRFVILHHIGSGGMGEVYLARDEVMNDDVALKIIRPELSEDPRIRQRFISEVRNARRVTHTNVCHVYDIVERAELPFFTMEYLPGRTLAEALATDTLDINVKRRVAAQLANGLDAAHLRGIIHRDFKPANVMLTERNGHLDAVIMDFGLARTEEMADPGNLHSLQAGTEEYMAPELLQGGKATLQSDVYAYGVVLRQLLPEHPLLPKLLAPRPEDRQPSLRAVIASFEGTNGQATRRMWLLGAAASAASVYSLWKIFNPPPVTPVRQKILINDLAPLQRETTAANDVQSLLVLALQQSPLLAVIAGNRLKTELSKLGLSVDLPVASSAIPSVLSKVSSGYFLHGELEPVGAGLALNIRLISPDRSRNEIRIRKTVERAGQLIRLAEESALQIRRDIGESDLAIRNSYSPLERVTSASPEAVQYYFEAVRTYEQADADSSLIYLQRALEIDPEFALAHHYRSLSLSAKERRGEALLSSEKAFRHRSKLSPRERLWIEAVYYIFREDRQRALDAYRAAVLLFPEDPVLHRQYAAAHCQKGNFQEAIAENRKALELDPFSENGKSELIVNLVESTQYTQALEEYSRFVTNGDNNTLLSWGSGLAYMGLGDYRRATLQFEAMAKTANRKRWAHLLLVGPLLLQGDWEGARLRLQADLAIDRYGVDVTRRLTRLEWLAWTELVLRRPASARECVLQLLDAEPGPHNTQVFRTAARIALRCADSATYARAVDLLEREHQHYPTPDLEATLLHCDGERLERNGNTSDALERVTRAAAISADPIIGLSALRLRRSLSDAAKYLSAARQGEGTLLKYHWPGFLLALSVISSQMAGTLGVNVATKSTLYLSRLSKQQAIEIVKTV